jgi:hypothetical protein
MGYVMLVATVADARTEVAGGHDALDRGVAAIADDRGLTPGCLDLCPQLSLSLFNEVSRRGGGHVVEGSDQLACPVDIVLRAGQPLPRVVWLAFARLPKRGCGDDDTVVFVIT